MSARNADFEATLMATSLALSMGCVRIDRKFKPQASAFDDGSVTGYKKMTRKQLFKVQKAKFKVLKAELRILE